MLTSVNRPPPPRPCTTLPATSMLILIAAAASALPKKKMPDTTKRIGLRPQMSLTFPHIGVDAALDNM